LYRVVHCEQQHYCHIICISSLCNSTLLPSPLRLLLLLLPPGAEPGAIEWNYTKFLVDRQGQAIARYKPAFTDFEADVSICHGLSGVDILSA
jgi:glutathione peroxidase-family protein